MGPVEDTQQQADKVISRSDSVIAAGVMEIPFNLIPQGALSLVYGLFGAGHSFIAL
jgi:ABC-type uncharacterized transport system ATPase subunit